MSKLYSEEQIIQAMAQTMMPHGAGVRLMQKLSEMQHSGLVIPKAFMAHFKNDEFRENAPVDELDAGNAELDARDREALYSEASVKKALGHFTNSLGPRLRDEILATLRRGPRAFPADFGSKSGTLRMPEVVYFDVNEDPLYHDSDIRQALLDSGIAFEVLEEVLENTRSHKKNRLRWRNTIVENITIMDYGKTVRLHNTNSYIEGVLSDGHVNEYPCQCSDEPHMMRQHFFVIDGKIKRVDLKDRIQIDDLSKESND